jgi:hypothetical protein
MVLRAEPLTANNSRSAGVARRSSFHATAPLVAHRLRLRVANANSAYTSVRMEISIWNSRLVSLSRTSARATATATESASVRR